MKYIIGGFLAGLFGASTATWEKGTSMEDGIPGWIAGQMGQPNPSQWLPFGPQGSAGKGVIPPVGPNRGW